VQRGRRFQPDRGYHWQQTTYNNWRELSSWKRYFRRSRPFLENEMFDFAFHLPRRAKLHRSVGKWLVKQAAAEVLPTDVVYARKKGFPLPNEFSLGTQRLLAGMVGEFLQWPADTTQEIIAMLGKDEHLRFHLVGLELWFRLFFGGETPEALGEKLAGLAEDATAVSRPLFKEMAEIRHFLCYW
jgi:hypothetical protein